MLYIEFQIHDSSKFTDFRKLYEHMLMVRQPDFSFQEEIPEFDWDNMNQEEVDEAVNVLSNIGDDSAQEQLRYAELMPSYADDFLTKFIKHDNADLNALGVLTTASFLNYLEFGFDVELNNLSESKPSAGRVEFSTGNFPFGGLDRFFIALKAFSLTPVRCFDGFSSLEIHWTGDFAYQVTELPVTS